MIGKKTLKKNWQRITLATGGALLCVLVLAQTGTKPAPAASKARTARAAEATAVAVEPMPDRQPLGYYTGGIRRNLFGAPAAPPAPAAKSEPVLPLPAAGAEVADVDPFVDYAYTGTAMLGGQPVALIENKKTKEGQFLHAGDMFLGGRIERIADGNVTMSIQGKSRTLAKNDDYKLTPLDKNAPITVQAATPGAGGPGGMDRAAMRQRFMNATPAEREQMRQQFMNGGGFGGRGGGAEVFGGGGFGGRGGGGRGGRGGGQRGGGQDAGGATMMMFGN